MKEECEGQGKKVKESKKESGGERLLLVLSIFKQAKKSGAGTGLVHTANTLCYKAQEKESFREMD